ncbi:glutamine-hydrolyzing carbamoyl-phosphate synthase small subunit [Alphaproteobacteria bacterium]|nr:glutamine-hydrolyzing carbamoyl-phosphate synthase small subunit [Alphaproteobacteria bacterium]
MKVSNTKTNLPDDGYIPFNLNKIKNKNILDTILILDDGNVFFGRSFGSKKTSIGEICFNTSLTGYQEIITDPSYANQIITFTFPHIGNTGSNSFDNEGNTKSIAGIVVRQHPTNPSNWRSNKNFDEWLIENNIPGISGIDTRLLTKITRKYRTCNALLSYNKDSEFDIDYLKEKLKKHPSMDGSNLSTLVTTKNPYSFDECLHNFISTQSFFSNNFKTNIVVIDFGVKQNILRHLVNLNANVTIMSENSKIEEITKLKPDGIFLSNGPGDPSATEKKCRQLLKSLFMLKIPVFGICIGHQLFGLSFGAKTCKMPQGHRGANHPVKNLSNNKVEITSQNHGYHIELETLPECLKVTHISLFDKSIEGLMHKELPFFSVQYHPEASPGPTESSYLFENFLNLIKESKANAKT